MIDLWTPKSNWRTLSLQLVVHFATWMSLLPPHFRHTVRIEGGRKWGVGCRTQNFALTVCGWSTNRLSAHTWTKLQRCRGFSQHMIAPKSNLKCINLVFFYFPLSSPRVGKSGRWSVTRALIMCSKNVRYAGENISKLEGISYLSN